MNDFFTRLREARPWQLAGWLCIGLGVIGLVGATVNVERVKKPPVQNRVLTSSAPKPSAKQVATYTVPPSDPRFIAIPAIGLGNTPVLAFGLAADGTIETPDSVYETGWYNASSKPGQAGAMFIYGHIASWTQYSVFANLSKLKPGDEVTVTRGDNAVFHYRVTGSQTYPYNAVDMGRVLAVVQPGAPGLNLMTCAGQIITVGGAKEYSQRLVVFTKQI